MHAMPMPVHLPPVSHQKKTQVREASAPRRPQARARGLCSGARSLPRGVELVVVDEDGEQHREDLARGGDGGAHERLEVGDGVEDEGLPHGRARGERRDVAEDHLIKCGAHGR